MRKWLTFTGWLALGLCLGGCNDSSVTINDTRDPGLYLKVVDQAGNPVEGVRVHLVALPDLGQGDALVPIPEDDCTGEVR